MKFFTPVLSAMDLMWTGTPRETLPALKPDHYLYKIEDHEGNHMYMVGTMHIAANPTILDGYLRIAYNNSKKIIFEIDLGEADKYQQQMLELWTTDPVKTIKSKEFDRTWEKIKQEYPYITDEDLNWNAIYIQNLITNQNYTDAKAVGNYGVDMTILRQANEDKKTIGEIESYQYQLDTLAQMGKEAPMVMLKSCALPKKEEQVQYIKDLIKAYAAGDEDFILNGDNELIIYNHPEEFESEEMQKELAFLNTLNTARSTAMFQKAQQYVKENNTLLCIGAAHVIGTNGLAHQFQQAGYTVTKCETASQHLAG